MTSAKTIRHIRTLHAQGYSVADIHLITGVCADTTRGTLTAPADPTPVPPAGEHPDPMARIVRLTPHVKGQRS